jgi:hypothetical protein
MSPRPLALALSAALLLVLAPGGCSLAGLDEPLDASAPTDGSSPSDGGKPSGDACKATEDCGNGVDDDCNGKTDCEDPACQKAGFACTAGEVPAGWTLVAYDAAKRAVCPSGFGDERAVVSDVSGAPATCSCMCSGGPAQCVGTTVFNRSSDACTTLTGTTVDVNNGACSPISTQLLSGYAYQLDQLGPEPTAQQGTCSGAGAVMGTLPPVAFTAGATCAVSRLSSSGCSSGTVCVPPTPSSGEWKTCITHPGTVACPTFGFAHSISVSRGTPGYVDGRGCGPCPCATSLGCGSASGVTLFTGSGCTGAAYGIDIGCSAPVGSTTSEASYQVGFSTTGSAACGATGASAATGGVMLDSEVETICCMP